MKTVFPWLLSLALLTPSVSAQGSGTPVLDAARRLATTRFAGFTWGTGKDKVDCTAFLLAAVVEAGKGEGLELTRSQRKQLVIANLTKEELARLDELVEAGHRKIRGVQTALTQAGLGKAVAPKDARPGDLVQYWYRTKKGWRGHAVIVERIDDGVATLYGSHKTTLASERKLPRKQRRGGIGSGPRFALTDAKRKVYVVRWTGKAPEPAKR